jgi:hypothetical protein
MPHIFGSQGPTALLADGLVAANPYDEPVLRAVQSVPDRVVKRESDLRTSGKLSAEGLKDVVAVDAPKAMEDMKAHDAAAQRRGEAAKATRTKALAAWLNGERTVENLMLEREIRDRTVGMDEAVLRAKYFEAIQGKDRAFVSAVENAPAAFPLIDAETRARGEDMKLQGSPYAAQLAREEREHADYVSVVAAAKAEIRQLATRYGIRLDEAPVLLSGAAR